MGTHNGKRVVRSLRCDLTSDQVLERGAELAATLNELDKNERDLDSLKQQYKAKIQGNEGRIKELQHIVTERSEFREVSCTWAFSYEEGKKRLYRSDTGEMVEDAPLGDDDVQSDMDFDHPSGLSTINGMV